MAAVQGPVKGYIVLVCTESASSVTIPVEPLVVSAANLALILAGTSDLVTDYVPVNDKPRLTLAIHS